MGGCWIFREWVLGLERVDVGYTESGCWVYREWMLGIQRVDDGSLTHQLHKGHEGVQVQMLRAAHYYQRMG